MFNAVLALEHNRNEEGFETKFGCETKLNSFPLLAVSLSICDWLNLIPDTPSSENFAYVAVLEFDKRFHMQEENTKLTFSTFLLHTRKVSFHWLCKM